MFKAFFVFRTSTTLSLFSDLHCSLYCLLSGETKSSLPNNKPKEAKALISSSLSRETLLFSTIASLIFASVDSLPFVVLTVNGKVLAVGSFSIVFVIVEERQQAKITGRSNEKDLLRIILHLFSLMDGNFSIARFKFSKYFEESENVVILKKNEK